MKTKLFNIRITDEKHRKFKKYAEKKNVSMGYLLNSYIDSLLDDSIEPVGIQPEQKVTKLVDPVEAIRSQYKPGIDF
ncbi:MAG: hypothetical protein VW270_14020 [Candidatus Poseidoniales archaeon]